MAFREGSGRTGYEVCKGVSVLPKASGVQSGARQGVAA